MTDHNGIDPQAYNNFGGTDSAPYMPPYPHTDNYTAPYPYTGATGYTQPLGMDMQYGAPAPDRNPYGSPPSPQDPYASQSSYGATGVSQTGAYYPSGYGSSQGSAPSGYNPYPPQASYSEPYNNYAPQPTYDWSAQPIDPYASPRFSADPYPPQAGSWQSADTYRAAVAPQTPRDQVPPYFGGAPSSQGYHPASSPPATGTYYEAGAYPISPNDPQAAYAASASPAHSFEAPRFERRVFQASDIQRQQANSQQIYGYRPPQVSAPHAPPSGELSRSMYPGGESYPEMPTPGFGAMAPPMATFSSTAPPMMPPVVPGSAAAAMGQAPLYNPGIESPPAMQSSDPEKPLGSAAPETTAPPMWAASPPITVSEPAIQNQAPLPSAAAPESAPPSAQAESMFFAPNFFAQMPPNESAPPAYSAPATPPAPEVAPQTESAKAASAQGFYNFPAPPLDPTAFSPGGSSFSSAPPLDSVAAPADGSSVPGAPSFDPTANESAPLSTLEKNIFESNFTINPDEQASSKTRQARLGDTEIFRIAEELSQAVLVKSLNRAFNDNNLMPEGDSKLISVQKIFSDYFVSESGGQPYRMFEGLSFDLRAGCCCILISDLPLAAYALARSICESADKGDPDEPVTVAALSDGYPGNVMYIGSDSMLPDEMTCKEFLLYTQGSGEEEPEVESERVDALFTQLGAGNLIDTDLRDLSYNKRILLLVLAAALNPNIVGVVVNDPKFSVGSEEEMLARRIFALVNNRGKCSLISCASNHLMAAVANRVAIIKGGRLIFFDSYRRFLDEYCLGIMTFSAENPQEIAAAIEPRFPGINVLCKDNFVYIVRRQGSPEMPLETLISDVMHMGIDYNTIVMDDKSFAVACKEAFRK